MKTDFRVNSERESVRCEGVRYERSPNFDNLRVRVDSP